MADVITRFRLETTQYDSKLRDAAKGLKEITHQAQLGGKGFSDFSKKAVESARALGNTASGAMNTKEKVRDLVGAFNEAAKAYNSLNQAQQQTDFGKNLAASLETLKGRIAEAKQELYGLGDAMGKSGGGGLFAGLGDKMSGMLQVFGGNMLTKAAGAVANLGSEMYGMVQQGVELARQGEGIRNAFERLGRGDILDGLRQATHGTVTDIELMKAAVKFNDFKLPLDELGTMLAFAQQKAKDTGQSVDYMVDSIVTGLGRKSLMILDNLGLSATEVKERMAETGDMTKAVGAIIRDQMAKAGDYVETAADRATQADVELKNAMEDLGRTFQPLTDASEGLWNSIKVGALNALNSAVKPLIQALAEAGALGSGARATAGFNRLGGESKVDSMIDRLGNGKTAGSYSIYTQQLGKFDKYINNKRFQIAAYGNDNSSIAQSAKARLQADLDGALKMRAEYVKRAQELHNKVPSPFEPATTSGGATGGSGGSSRGASRSGFDISKIAFDENKAALAAVKMPEPEGGSDAWNTMREAIAGCREEMADYSAETENWTKNFDPYRENMDKMTKAAQQQQKAFSMGAQAAANLGAAFASIEDPAAKAAGVVISAIANIALGFAQAAAAKDTTASGWAWLAWLAAGTAALATTISTVHSLTGYANGGVIKGNSYSGDNIGGMVDGGAGGFVGLNAGEVVLNTAQTSNVAAALTDGGREVSVHGRLVGEDIFISADRYARRSGRGEILTWKHR